jgi:hypothetical protein
VTTEYSVQLVKLDKRLKGLKKTHKLCPIYTKPQIARLQYLMARSLRPNLSCLDLFQDINKFEITVFDPMHSVFLGAVRTYLFEVFQLGAHGSSIITSDPSGASRTAIGGVLGSESDGGASLSGDGENAENLVEVEKLVEEIELGE